MSKYLKLNDYNGSLHGLKSYPAGPEDVSSPGGLATIQHHWTHGMGGKGDLTPDVFAGTGDRYISGEYGHMYHPESHASVHDRYSGPYTDLTKNSKLNGQPYYWESKKNNVEGFTTNISGDFDLIEGVEENKSSPTQFTNVENMDDNKKVNKNKNLNRSTAYILLFIFLIAFIAFGMWTETAHKFLKYFHGGKVSWKTYLIYSIVATLILFAIMYLVDIPLEMVEEIM